MKARITSENLQILHGDVWITAECPFREQPCNTRCPLLLQDNLAFGEDRSDGVVLACSPLKTVAYPLVKDTKPEPEPAADEESMLDAIAYFLEKKKSYLFSQVHEAQVGENDNVLVFMKNGDVFSVGSDEDLIPGKMVTFWVINTKTDKQWKKNVIVGNPLKMAEVLYKLCVGGPQDAV